VVENKVWSPTLITIPNLKVKKIQLGRDFTLLSDMETIKLYGKDRYGIDSYIPTHFTDFKTMWSSVHLIENNDIRSIGNNSHSQLLSLGEDIQFEDFDVGSEHGLLLSSNTVYAWGWGEHGNCGVKTNSSNSFDLTILFETSEKVVKLQGGCATSWVITAT
jgi:protein ATS1